MPSTKVVVGKRHTRLERREGRRWLLALAALALAGGLAVSVHRSGGSGPNLQGLAASNPQSTSVQCTPTSVLNTWSVSRLADQTIAFPAEEASLGSVAAAAEAGYGSIILFGTTAPSNLAAQLATLRDDVPDHLGLLVMTDEEGGGVQRMANLVGNMPWAAQMGETMTAAQIETLADSVGSEMYANGVNMDLAPVLDVDGRAVAPGAQDPDGYRSFSGTTSVVSTDGTAFMRGMMNAQVLPVVKHFPGLGGVSQNTDDGPAWTLPWSTLQKVALPPFEAAIAAGAPAVMVSNAKVKGLTTIPASLSRQMVTGELRDALGFKGLIITDSLSAGAIADPPLSLTVPEASVMALEAGADMVLFNSTGDTADDLTIASDTSNAIVAAVASGALPKSQLVSAVAQVFEAKNVNLCPGYWLTTTEGNVYNLGTSAFFGSKATKTLPAPVVGISPTPDGQGYWLVTSAGNVFNYGDAGWFGSKATKPLPGPVVGMDPTPDGQGYWLVTTKGNVFNFGNAGWFGSEATKPLPGPVVGMASNPAGDGYWLVTTKGNVFNFGNAGWFGSEATKTLPAPVVAMALTPDGKGYWLVTSKGNVYNFGDAKFYGSEATKTLPSPVVGIARSPDGLGYWLETQAGTVYSFGDAEPYGSEVTTPPAPVVGLAPN
ncbi:MAG: glycoside hydrolase family 3 N-terminal domain-containing protein [Acidimicrobiales bacterium]